MKSKKIISLILSIILIVTSLSSLSINAYAAITGHIEDDVYWSFNEETETLIIYGNGEIPGFDINLSYPYSNYTNTEQPWYKYYESIKHVEISEGITNVSNNCFNECNFIEDVSLPSTLQYIDDESFCQCESLDSIFIPDGVTFIGGVAFAYCSSLTTVVIPKSVTIIDKGAFSECSNLKEVYYQGTIDDWKNIRIGSNNECLKSANFHDECVECVDYHNEATMLDNVVEPTCTDGGTCDKVVYCKFCNKEFSRVHTDLETLVDKSKYPESRHKYLNSISSTYSFSYPNAKQLRITFSSLTKTESGFDYIYLYDSKGSLIGRYDDDKLAKKTFTIDGSSFSLKLTSDDSDTEYGFSFSSIYAIGAPLGHDLLSPIEFEHVDSTCTMNGYTKTHQMCSRCNEFFNEKTTNFNKISHDLGPVVEVYNSEATCTSRGSTITAQYCSQCEQAFNYKTQYTDPKGHTPTEVEYKYPSTCSKLGYSDFYTRCSECGYIISTRRVQYTEFAPHKYYEELHNPTCTNAGYTLYTCRYCSYHYTEPIDPIGHNYILLNSEFYGESNCVSAPSTMYSYECANCHDKYSDWVYGSYGDHDYYSVEYKAPSCTDKGYYKYECMYCYDTYYDFIPKNGHNYSKKIVAPTYFAEGYTLHTCSDCGKTYKDNKKAKKVLSKPSITLSAKSKGFSVKYNKVTSASGYQIQYATSSSFKSAKVIKTTSLSKSVTKLKAKKKYYVRVRAYKTEKGKTVYSAWSSAKSITTKK